MDLFLALDTSICSPVAFLRLCVSDHVLCPLFAISLKEVAFFHHIVLIIIVLIEVKLVSANFLFSTNYSPLKTMKSILFHLKSSFCSPDIQFFVIVSLSALSRFKSTNKTETRSIKKFTVQTFAIFLFLINIKHDTIHVHIHTHVCE